MPNRPLEAWADGGAYERYVGRWGRPVARQFLDWLAQPPRGRWLDLGCGTGALSQQILAAANPSRVVGVDPSAGYLAVAERQASDQRAAFVIGDARRLPFASGAFDAVVSGLALNFVPEADRAVAEMARVSRPGGVVAAYVWDYGAGGIELIRRFWDAAAAIDPAAVDLNEDRRFGPFCRPEALASRFAGAGLHAVETRPIDVPTVFPDFDDYWQPFLGGQGPAPHYLAGLDPARQDAIRDRLRATLPAAPDGSIRLAARAWAVRGVR